MAVGRRRARATARSSSPRCAGTAAAPSRCSSASATTTSATACSGSVQCDPRARRERSRRGRRARRDGRRPGRARGRAGRRAARPAAADFPVPATNTAALAGHRPRVLHRAREQELRRALRRPAGRRRRARRYTLDAGAGGHGEHLAQPPRGWRAPSRSATTTTPTRSSRRRATCWTTYGRTSDFNERTWASRAAAGSPRAIPGGGVIAVGQPVEGSLFDWLVANKIPYNILGEIDGEPARARRPAGAARRRTTRAGQAEHRSTTCRRPATPRGACASSATSATSST